MNQELEPIKVGRFDGWNLRRHMSELFGATARGFLLEILKLQKAIFEGGREQLVYRDVFAGRDFGRVTVQLFRDIYSDLHRARSNSLTPEYDYRLGPG